MKEVLKNMETDSLKSSTVEIVALDVVVLKVRALGREAMKLGPLHEVWYPFTRDIEELSFSVSSM